MKKPNSPTWWEILGGMAAMFAAVAIVPPIVIVLLFILYEGWIMCIDILLRLIG